MIETQLTASQSPTKFRIYEQTMTMRFDDLDPYGHVNASRYIDLIGSSRFIYISRVFGLSSEDFLARGCGWFLGHVDCTYKRPIRGLCDVVVRSWVEQLPTDSRFPVDFEICDPSEGKTFAKGRLSYVTMDMKSNKPANLPDWVVPYLFLGSEQL